MNQREPLLLAAEAGDSHDPSIVPHAYAASVQDGELYPAYDGTHVTDWWWVILPSQVPSDRPAGDDMLGFTCRMEQEDDRHWRVRVQGHFRDAGDRPGSAVVLLIHR